MTIDISHVKNPALGWDITADIKADSTEKISQVCIVVNGFSKCEETLASPAQFWKKTIIQQGVFPGDNSVTVSATDGDGQQISAVDEWTGQ